MLVFQQKLVSLQPQNRNVRALEYGVMVTLQILVLSFQVRILVLQPKRPLVQHQRLFSLQTKTSPCNRGGVLNTESRLFSNPENCLFCLFVFLLDVFVDMTDLLLCSFNLGLQLVHLFAQFSQQTVTRLRCSVQETKVVLIGM